MLSITRFGHASPQKIHAMGNSAKIAILNVKKRLLKNIPNAHAKKAKLPIKIPCPTLSILLQVANLYVLRLSGGYKIKIYCLINLKQEEKL